MRLAVGRNDLILLIDGQDEFIVGNRQAIDLLMTVQHGNSGLSRLCHAGDHLAVGTAKSGIQNVFAHLEGTASVRFGSWSTERRQSRGLTQQRTVLHQERSGSIGGTKRDRMLVAQRGHGVNAVGGKARRQGQE